MQTGQIRVGVVGVMALLAGGLAAPVPAATGTEVAGMASYDSQLTALVKRAAINCGS